MDPGGEPTAYPRTLNASVKVSKPSCFKPSESNFERYKPARMGFSLFAIRCALRGTIHPCCFRGERESPACFVVPRLAWPSLARKTSSNDICASRRKTVVEAECIGRIRGALAGVWRVAFQQVFQ